MLLENFITIILLIGFLFSVFALYGLFEVAVTIYNTKKNTNYPRFTHNPNE